jgi:cytoskeletal protein CcmA (bactofilin family)
MTSIFGKKKQDDDAGSTHKPLLDSKGPQTMAEPSKVETIIGPGATIKGEVHTRGTLRVDGNVEGKVNADGSVIVGEKGVVKAEINAGLVVIGGTVHGKVNGREKVEILSTGRLHGDVSTKPAKFVVAEGVIFEGRCTMGQAGEEPKQTVPKTKPPEAEKQEVSTASKP